MDALSKIVFKKGIAFSHCFQYNVDGETYSKTVGDILDHYLNKNKSRADFTSTFNHLKKSPMNVALSFLDGMGMKLVHEEVLGKDAFRLSLILNMITHSDKGIPLQIVNEIGEIDDWVVARTKGNEFILGKAGDTYNPINHRELTERLSTLIKRVVGLPGDESEGKDETKENE